MGERGVMIDLNDALPQRSAGGILAARVARLQTGDVEQGFIEAMAKRGLVQPKGGIVADGKIHRCDTTSRNGEGDGSYCLHLDNGPPAGWFQNHQDGKVADKWSQSRPMSLEERQLLKNTQRQLAEERKAQQERDRAAAAERARSIWQACPPAPDDHPYLVRKGVPSYGLRLSGNHLVVPIHKDRGNWLASLQHIAEDGEKRFLRGGEKQGGSFAIGDFSSVETLLIAEGYATAATLHRATGYPCLVAFDSGNLTAVAKEARDALPGACIVLCADDDSAGRKQATAAAAAVNGLVAVPAFPAERDDKWTDFNDLETSIGGEDGQEEVGRQIQHQIEAAVGSGAAPSPAPAAYPRRTIQEVVEVFRRWLHMPDPGPIYATLGTVCANLLPGRPVWLALVGAPCSAKTELINSTSLLPYVYPATALSPPALLSGTPNEHRSKDATGGLLARIGSRKAIIAMKDLGSVLSMRPDDRATCLAALREVYDGAWTRDLGTDGGMQLFWRGKVGMIAGSTEAVDSHSDTMAQLGERLAFYRLEDSDEAQLDYAILQASDGAARMTRELREAVAGLFVHCDKAAPITKGEQAALKQCSWRAVRLRSAVVRDRRTREIEAVHKTEGPARLFLMLERLFIGIATLGVDRATALDTVKRVAMDSVPLLRRRAYELIESEGGKLTKDIVSALSLPRTTVRRVLEDLEARKLLMRCKTGKEDFWHLPGDAAGIVPASTGGGQPASESAYVHL
jgi:putative DNA primase/helicase